MSYARYNNGILVQSIFVYHYFCLNGSFPLNLITLMSTVEISILYWHLLIISNENTIIYVQKRIKIGVIINSSPWCLFSSFQWVRQHTKLWGQVKSCLTYRVATVSFEKEVTISTITEVFLCRLPTGIRSTKCC